jgi:hypothetical protein
MCIEGDDGYEEIFCGFIMWVDALWMW